MASKEFRVSYFFQGEDGWLASIYTVPGCHCEGSTKEEAASKVRWALGHFFEKAEVEEAILIEVEDPRRRLG